MAEMITSEQIIQVSPYKLEASIYADILVEMMNHFEINTKPRITAFLAQIMHETGSFKFVQEIASGTAYEGRKDLGNIKAGDGVKYKGRGLIMTTGRSNYDKFGKLMNLDLINNPKLLLIPENAVWAACLFWKEHNLNAMADKFLFKSITKVINGGLNGYKDRLHYYEILNKLEIK